MNSVIIVKKLDKEKLEKIFDIIANIFQRKCDICGESFDKLRKGKRKAFTVHHREYKEDELTYADFTVDGKYDKLAYYEYLLPIVILYPQRFRFLHHSHHYMSEKWARFKPQTLEKMIELAVETNKIKYKKA